MKISKFVGFSAVVRASGLIAHGQAAKSRTLLTGISHLSVYVSDGAKAEAFYVHDLGGVKRPDPENSKGVRYYFSPVQFVEVLPLQATETSINRLDHVAFITLDAEGLRQYMGAHDIVVPKATEGGEDGSRWFDVSDPEGNKVQFVQPPAKPAPLPPNPLSD